MMQPPRALRPLRPRGVAVRPGVLATVLVGIVKLYQATAGVCLRPRCRFWPSCSHYAKEALLTLPLHTAVGATLWRLARCQPFGRGGVDPVASP